MLCEGPYNGIRSRFGANVSFDGLATHLASKHSQTLRSLHMMSAFVGLDAFRLICERCVVLEECSVSLGIRSLVRVDV
jgi:hypothetical protein